MELISSDKTKCVKCNACVDICPMRVITTDEAGYPKAVSNAFKTCINCGYCVDVCAFGALTHRVRKRSLNSNAALRRLKKIKENRKKRGEPK
ncbi:4Fe-4S dicluster domain-containing protein [Butyricicoccus sp. Marseille-Q5471]|uniref:4Fe-4S dicluster domain-containing protein n=1 Tax=Butyricicoccus sp. Marseille-Q5471 TaxID=3039493 RepID=UPI0024BD45E4|nr:4Fe-4S dicluster domain-containing protein [Butyricicoccus sp. Marseille-Q5471]